MPGAVGKVREFDRGVEADVCVGWTKDAYVNIRVTGNSPATKKALETLKECLKAEAHDLLLQAQASERSRGRKPIGAAS